jgi:queuine tRNA-ribosyltransferase
MCYARLARAGGLHAFIGWRHPILTDSGGYQVFSLASMRTVTEERVEFRSHLDGALCALSPERAADIQAQLGSDIAMVLDEVVGPEARASGVAMERSARWAQRGRARFLQLRDDPRSAPGVIVTNPGQAQFGIVQGGVDTALRTESVQRTREVGFEGYAIGGISVGEPAAVMYALVRQRAIVLTA